MGDDPLFGREMELDRLTALLDLVTTQGSTHGNALVLRGEAGVGKSSLLARAVTEASRRELRVLTTTGVQAEVHVPFGGLRRLLQRLRDDDAAKPARHAISAAYGVTSAPDTQPFQVALAVLDLVTTAAADQPLLLAVEDAQWLDQPSWEVLSFVSRRLEADPIVLLIAMRDGEESNLRLFGGSLPQLRVESLTEAAAEALLDHRTPVLTPVLRARVLAESAGNPLGLVELGTVAARFGADALLPVWLPLTTRLEQTFAVLVSELPGVTRSLLLVAALDDGDGLDEILAASSIVEASPVTTPAVQPAIAAGLLDVDDSFRVRFRHPLVRSALRQGATVSQRHHVHAALATVLTGQDDRRVWHRAGAAMGVDEELGRDLVAVSARARRRGAYEAAMTALERSAELTQDRTERASRLLWAAYAAGDLGDHKKVVQLVRGVENEHLGPPEQARLSWLRETALGGGWSGPARILAFVDIVDEMRSKGDTDLAMESLVIVSLRCFWSNPDAQTRHAMIAAAERLDVSPMDPRLVSVLALVAPVERGRLAVDRMARLMPRLDSDPSHLHLLGTGASAVGALGLSALFLAASVAGLRGQGRIGILAQALVGQAWTAAQMADTRLCLTAASEGRALALEAGLPLWALTADLVRAHAEALRGNSGGAQALADAGERVLIPMGANPMLALALLARGIDALGSGRHADAYDQLSRIFDPSDLAYHPYVRFSSLAHLADAAVHCGRHDELRALTRALEPVAEQAGSPVLSVGLSFALAVLADDDDAEDVFVSTLAMDLSAWPFERARLHLAYGEWLRRQRRSADSRPRLREAAGTFDALGVVPWADRARRELRASGESLRRPVDATIQLTPHELQIAQLAAEGLTNRDIGERLFLSPRTISTHLYRIFPKVGVSSRAELTRIMASLTMRDPAGPDYVN